MVNTNKEKIISVETYYFTASSFMDGAIIITPHETIFTWEKCKDNK